jgi:hypothetical protein
MEDAGSNRPTLMRRHTSDKNFKLAPEVEPQGSRVRAASHHTYPGGPLFKLDVGSRVTVKSWHPKSDKFKNSTGTIIIKHHMESADLWLVRFDELNQALWFREDALESADKPAKEDEDEEPRRGSKTWPADAPKVSEVDLQEAARRESEVNHWKHEVQEELKHKHDVIEKMKNRKKSVVSAKDEIQTDYIAFKVYKAVAGF